MRQPRDLKPCDRVRFKADGSVGTVEPNDVCLVDGRDIGVTWDEGGYALHRRDELAALPRPKGRRRG